MEVWYLGFDLSHGQMHPQINKTAVILACPRPKTQDQIGGEAVVGLGWLLQEVGI